MVSLRPATWSVAIVGIAFLGSPQTLSAQNFEALRAAKQTLITGDPAENDEQAFAAMTIGPNQGTTDADRRAATAMSGENPKPLTDADRRAATAMSGENPKPQTDVDRKAAAAMSR